MSERLRLTLPFPPSDNVNHKKSRTGVYLSDETKIFREQVKLRMLKVYAPLVGQVWVSGLIYRPHDRFDFFNLSKALWDALEGYAYLNDRQIQGVPDGAGWHWAPVLDPVNPRVEVTLVGERWASLDETIEARVKAAAKLGRARRTKRLKRQEKQGRAAPYSSAPPYPAAKSAPRLKFSSAYVPPKGRGE